MAWVKKADEAGEAAWHKVEDKPIPEQVAFVENLTDDELLHLIVMRSPDRDVIRAAIGTMTNIDWIRSVALKFGDMLTEE